MVIDAEFLLGTFALFGNILIVALATGHLFGTAKVPALVNRIPVLVGAFTVSAVSMRLIFALASSAGVQLLDYADDQGWVYNNTENVRLVNGFLAGNPALCIGLILFTFAASMVLGGLSGWLLAKATLKLTPVLILMVTLGLTDIGCVLGRNTIWAAGGTMGVSVPDLLTFIPETQHAAWVIILIVIVIGVYFLLEMLEASPWGRLVAAAGDNPVTAASVGKDIVRIRGEVIFYTSGIMALAGTLTGFYYLFVNEAPFHNSPWLFWPLTAVLIGVPGNKRGTVLGTIILFAIWEAIIVFKEPLGTLLFFPVSFLESIFFSLLMLAALFLLPRRLAREKRRPMRGMVYDGVVSDAS